MPDYKGRESDIEWKKKSFYDKIGGSFENVDTYREGGTWQFIFSSFSFFSFQKTFRGAIK